MGTDESPFGVKDLSGGEREHTADKPFSDFPTMSYRGGSRNQRDEEYFHIGSRNSLSPKEAYTDFGVRLAADVPPGDSGLKR